MTTERRHPFELGLYLLALATLAGNGACGSRSSRAPEGHQRSALSVPIAACTPGAGTVTCELWAKAGTLALPGGVTVPIWGYSDTADGAPTLPGPAIVVSEGDRVQITLHNTLPEATALFFKGQAMPPDLTGAAAGTGTATYSFTASSPGTYLYEAGIGPEAQQQVAMGLAGALVVRPAGSPGQAYADPATAFTVEELLVLGELDPALNGSADPAQFDMRSFAPRYFLLNGKAHPQTAPIPASAGDRVLLRYVNAGLRSHSMALLGLDQLLLAKDASPRYAHPVVAESIEPGQTLDVLVTIPSTATDGRFALYDRGLSLHNAGAPGVGGMLTFITVGSGTAPAGGGPVTTDVALTPGATDGATALALSATVSDASTGNEAITGAEYFLDAPGTSGSGTAMSGTFGSPTVTATATLGAGVLTTLASGTHTLYVHGQDASAWGPFRIVTFIVDRDGPATRALALSPNPARGGTTVSLGATGDDRASGGAPVVAAEYWVDDGTHLPMIVAPAPPPDGPGASIASLSAELSTAGLAEGSHAVHVRSRDALGTWGADATAALVVDATGPAVAAGSATAQPNPTNGRIGFNSSTAAVRVRATFADAASNVVAGEGFIDDAGGLKPDGTGFPFVAVDGAFDAPTEALYADIPLPTILQLASGAHTIQVHGRDAVGNWGARVSVDLVVDELAPTTSAGTATLAGASIVLAATATDPAPATRIAAAEWFTGTDPGPGRGRAMLASDGAFDGASEGVTATLGLAAQGWINASRTIFVRARDAAGNWGTAIAILYTPPNAIFADGFAAGTASWSSVTGSPVSGAGVLQVAGNAVAYVTDLTPALEPAYRARFLFNPNGMNAGNNNPVDIFTGLSGGGATLFQVQYRRQNAAGGTYQVRAVVARAGGTTATSWYTITNGSLHPIQIAWASAASAQFQLFTDGALRQTLSGLNTGASTLEAVRLGAVTAVPGATGTMSFDTFASTRFTGP